MKTIGIVGGLAWPSTAEYYRLINQEVSRLMGGSGRHCAKLVLAQTDFDAVERAQAADDWDAVASAHRGAGQHSQGGGSGLSIS
jgi:aspartate racemase